MQARYAQSKIVVSDIEKSVAFYTTVLGFTEVHRIEFTGPDVIEVVLAGADGKPSLVLIAGDALPVHSGQASWTNVVLNVDDAAAAAEELKAAGHELAFEPPLSVGGVTITIAVDPDGYLVEIISSTGEVLESLPEGTAKIPHPIPEIHERVLR
ncbi:VOC family protein [Actinocorallia sp. API 0066]|uniref:VOC family protein n=1 Tax=Actinocorallia sp. API 0066 TaxID=2896846 RepID=UPI001E2D5CC0|nr:VOC family protein [Actinocorallia sp. API 0066]MCD0449123.1 VOC family protein [Actinocorallia sp. API 0066]